MAFARSRNFFWRTFYHHLPAGISTFGTHIDDMIRTGDQVQIMLDDDHRISTVDQFVKHTGEQANI